MYSNARTFDAFKHPWREFGLEEIWRSIVNATEERCTLEDDVQVDGGRGAVTASAAGLWVELQGEPGPGLDAGQSHLSGIVQAIVIYSLVLEGGL